MPAINFAFLTNNDRGLKLTKKRIKSLEYFKSKLAFSSVLFAQDTHSTKEIKQKWKDELNGQIFFLAWEMQFVWCFYSFFWQ